MIAVIQLDGLGVEPTERLLAEGRMPNLGAALDAAPPLPLRTPAPLFPASVYPSLYSGAEPAEHGLFYPFQWDPARGAVVPAERLPKPELIWQRLGRAGCRSLVIDPYECAPAPAGGARVISGWQLSERVVLRRWARPLSLWPRAALAAGPSGPRPPRATETFGPRRERELRRLAAGLLAAPGRVAQLLERELRRSVPDLAWVNFVATHIAGHRLWGSAELDEIYVTTDLALGRVLAALPAGAETVVLCPLGMAADSARADLLPEMLARTLAPGAAGEESAGSEDSGGMWRLRAAVPASLRSAVAAAIPAPVARELTARLELRGVDWARTPAFAHPSDNQGYVRLNLRGRERHGIVDAGDAAALCAEIEAGLRSFEGSNGASVVEEVVRVAEGPASRSALPDLVVRWAPGSGELGIAHSPDHGTVRRHGAGSGRTGNHPDDGAWVSWQGLGSPGEEPLAITALARRLEERARSAATAPVPSAEPPPVPRGRGFRCSGDGKSSLDVASPVADLRTLRPGDLRLQSPAP